MRLVACLLPPTELGPACRFVFLVEDVLPVFLIAADQHESVEDRRAVVPLHPLAYIALQLLVEVVGVLVWQLRFLIEIHASVKSLCPTAFEI